MKLVELVLPVRNDPPKEPAHNNGPFPIEEKGTVTPDESVGVGPNFGGGGFPLPDTQCQWVAAVRAPRLPVPSPVQVTSHRLYGQQLSTVLPLTNGPRAAFAPYSSGSLSPESDSDGSSVGR